MQQHVYRKKRSNAALLLATVPLFATAVVSVAQDANLTSKSIRETIVLPLELVADQPATLAVLAANGHVAPGVTVTLSSGEAVTTDESGRAHFLAPPDAGVVFAQVSGTELREAADVLSQVANNGTRLTAVPRFVSVEDSFVVTGAGFQGDADRNRVEAGGKTVLVLASSPVQLILMPPDDILPGPTKFSVFEGAAELDAQATFVNVVSSVSSDAPIRPGEKIGLMLSVHGTSNPLELEITNLTPQLIAFAHGSGALVRTAGGPSNTAMIQVKGLNAGPFSFAVGLEDNSAKTDMPLARVFLEAARKIAPADVAKRLVHIERSLLKGNADTTKSRDELARVSHHGTSQDFQALIRAARRALSGE